MASCDRQLKEVVEWEAKLEELIVLRNSRDATIQESEVLMAEKDGALTRERTRAAKVETWLNQTTELLYLANKKVKVAEGEATSAVIRVVAKYKELDNFVNDAIEARADAYIVGFADCKKVAEALLALDLIGIVVPGEVEEVEEGEMAEQEAIGVDEVVTEVLRLEAIVVEGFEETATALEA